MRPAQNRAMPDSPQPKLLLSRAMSALTGRGPFASHSTTDAVGHNGSDGDSPAFPLVRALLEPPAGMEPATPSLPWIGGQALCYPAFLQVARHRKCRSYGLSCRS
jgi:hypothetical protein